MTNIQGPPPDANLPPVGGTPGQSGQTPGQASGQGDPEVQDGTEMIKKVFKGGGKGTTGTAQEGETPLQDIDEFGKMAGEALEDASDDLLESLGLKDKKKKTDQSRAARTQGRMATTLGQSQQGEQTQMKVQTSVQNTVGARASHPVLAPPATGEKIPMGEGGIGNPWLQPSLATALFSAWFEVLPILMGIKIEEAKAEAAEIIHGAELSKAKAEMIMEIHALEAEKLMTQAVSMFIQAGLQVAQMAVTLAMQVVGAAMNAVGGAVNAVGGIASGATGGAVPSMKMPTMGPQEMQMMTKMIDQGFGAATSIVQGVSKMIEASIEIEKGRAEYIKSCLEHMLQTSNQIQQAHREAKKEASELISTFIQAMNQFIQYETVFRTDIR